MRTRSATCLQIFVHQKRLSFCFTSYYSWIIKLLMLITTNPLDKTNETFNIYCTLYFHTVVLLSCSLHSYMHLFKFLFMFELAASIFWTKINRIYKREFSMCFQSSKSHPGSPHFNGKNPHQFVQKHYDLRKCKNLQRLFKTSLSILITFIQPEHFFN